MLLHSRRDSLRADYTTEYILHRSGIDGPRDILGLSINHSVAFSNSLQSHNFMIGTLGGIDRGSVQRDCWDVDCWDERGPFTGPYWVCGFRTRFEHLVPRAS